VNKPKEFAHLLRDKFGSADQINMLGGMYVASLNIFIVFFSGYGALKPFCTFHF